MRGGGGQGRLELVQKFIRFDDIVIRSLALYLTHNICTIFFSPFSIIDICEIHSDQISHLIKAAATGCPSKARSWSVVVDCPYR